ncbi:sensor histidine kinase [Crassaminicella profunda]|uniref:sensor histidine kinase n=1 Tax=Crassaminicella profunda TaxID=1286698 RepID=UPI001CA72A38|nr:sensor histidine kinase [Crassaminicella profunda]QZY54029.1 sensor histidine kinase [Crassaminicella profunda]
MKVNYFKKLIRRILIYTMIICTVLTSILVFFSQVISKKMMMGLVDDQSFNNSQFYAERIGECINKKIFSMKVYANSPAIKSMDWNKIQPYLKRKNEQNENFYSDFFVADASGRKKGKNEYIGNSKYFKLSMKGEDFLYNIHVSKSDGDLMGCMTVPVRGKNNEVIGILGANINLECMNVVLKEFKVDHPKSYSYIIDKNGLIVSHPKKSMIMNENIIKLSDEVSGSLANSGFTILHNDMGYVEYNVEGISTRAYFHTIPHTQHWKIIVKVPKEYLYEPIQEKTNMLLRIAVLGTIVIGMISLALGQFIAAPMLKLKKDMEEDQKVLKEKIQYEKLKTEFFANISHELKTPLNIIFSTTQLLSLYSKNNTERIDSVTLNKHIRIMKQNCNRLLRLMNNLIDITKIDSGYMQLNLQNGNIIQVVEDIILSTAEYVESNGKNIIFDTDVEEKMMAFDPDKIERIVLNLISNALKFTNLEDSIFVNIYDGDEKILIRVKDTGIGIPEKKLMLIFERFRQVDSILTRKVEGSGIGLSLVKSFVEMHEGKIDVKSELKKGTEFMIELPVKLVDEENFEPIEKSLEKDNVEKINVEFSDIYS